MSNNTLLRKVIKNVISENRSASDIDLVRQLVRETLLTEKSSASEEFAAEEAALASELKAAEDRLVIWDAEKKKENALIAKAKQLGVSTNTAKKRYPELAFKYSAKSRESLVKDVENAREKYGQFEPAAVGYRKSKKEDSIKAVDDSQPTKTKSALLDWDPVTFSGQWTKWPKNIAKYSKVGFGKQIKGEETRGEAMGTGPGERWLAVIFGGKIMGGSVSYDVEIPDGTKCEVKELEQASSLIRPGTEGTAAVEAARVKLSTVMLQISDFLESFNAQKSVLIASMSDQDKQIIKYVKAFVDENYENIVSKGEISRGRIAELRSAMKAIKVLKTAHSTSADVKPEVTLNKKTVTVRRPVFIDIAKKVEKEAPEADILSDFETWDVVMNALKDEAFTDFEKFIDNWYSTTKASEVFRKVDGVFVVNLQLGFYWVPRAKLNAMFKFEKISQGKPKFSFAGF